MSALHLRPLRRRIISMLLWTAALLLLTNVCWSVWSAMVPGDPTGFERSSRESVMGLGSDRLLHVRATTSAKTWTRYVLDIVGGAPTDYAFARMADFTTVVPHWLQRRCRPENLEHIPEMVPFGEQSVGWPVRLLAVGWEYDLTAKRTTKGGIRIFDSSGPTDSWFRGILPVRPILAGQSFYAAFWLAVVWGIPFARRRFRMRRGHCPNCNYNLRGNTTGVCPECGANFNPPTGS